MPEISVGAAVRAARRRRERTRSAARIEHVFPNTEFTPRFLFSESERPNLVVRVRVRIDDPRRELHAGRARVRARSRASGALTCAREVVIETARPRRAASAIWSPCATCR